MFITVCTFILLVIAILRYRDILRENRGITITYTELHSLEHTGNGSFLLNPKTELDIERENTVDNGCNITIRQKNAPDTIVGRMNMYMPEKEGTMFVDMVLMCDKLCRKHIQIQRMTARKIPITDITSSFRVITCLERAYPQPMSKEYKLLVENEAGSQFCVHVPSMPNMCTDATMECFDAAKWQQDNKYMVEIEYEQKEFLVDLLRVINAIADVN
jgi:hypothetical protein